MSRVHPIFPSFTTGELSPLMYGRVDFAKFSSGLRTLLNYIIRPHGPVYRRPGTHFIAEVKNSANFTRLLKFEFSTEQAYQIEAGNLYFRFYRDGGRIESPPGTPVEVVTPYLSADLPLLKYVQNADTVYFAHPSYPVYKLVRLSHTSWTMAEVNWLPPATYEAGFKPATTLTLGATSGLNVTATAAAAAFEAGDVGRLITVGTGRASIRTFTSTTVVNVDIVNTFASAGPHASQAWTIEGSPNTSLTPSISQPAHAIVSLTLAAAGWRSTDVGRYVRVNKGVARIIEFTSTTVVRAELLTVLTNVTASPGGSWSVEDPEWTAARGYPRAIAFMEQRLVLGGTLVKPQAFWGSNTSAYEVIALGPDDDDAYSFIVATNDVNTINWMLPTRALLIGTASSEFAITGSTGATNAAISPNNVDVKASTFWGSSDRIQPLRIGGAGLFVSRTESELREMVFSLQRDSYIADDLLLLAEHLTKGAGATITDIAYQRHPNSVVWVALSTGVLLGLTYQREHDVVGWTRHITGPDAQTVTPVKGKFEAVVVTPHWQRDRDVAFFIVKRVINGVTKRYVEYMDDVNGYYGGLGMDSALTYTGVATNSISGLNHLIGETVTILGNGAVYPDAVVDGTGTVTIAGLAVTLAEIGLGFGSKLETMTVEVPQQGTSQGRTKHWAEIIVRVYQTIGMHINGDAIPFRTPQHDMDTAVPRQSGDFRRKGTGRDTSGIITVEQRQPLPQTICAIFGTLDVGE